MKLRMLLSLAGSDFALSRGDETERFGDAEALRLIEAAYAVLVTPAPVLPVTAPDSADVPHAGVNELPLAGESAIEDAAPSDERASTEAAVADLADLAGPIDPAEPADIEPLPSGIEPLVVEDDTERAARNPARKRRG